MLSSQYVRTEVSMDDVSTDLMSLTDCYFALGHPDRDEAGLLLGFLELAHGRIVSLVKRFVGDSGDVSGGTLGAPLIQPEYATSLWETLDATLQRLFGATEKTCLGTTHRPQLMLRAAMPSGGVVTQWYPKLPDNSSQTATPPVLVFGIIPTPLNEEESKKYAMAMYAWRFAAQIADDDTEDEFKHVRMTRWLPFKWEPDPEDCVGHHA